MESGLEDRNNNMPAMEWNVWSNVSMESGLEDRNNCFIFLYLEGCFHLVSMESGLEDRNNARCCDQSALEY